jgi:hypothetical protein
LICSPLSSFYDAVMRPTDQDDLSDFVTEFINGCGIESPFYLVSISTNGSVIVTHWSAVGEVHDVCERLHEIAVLPIVLAVISLDGRCASARIVGGDH